jgi:hypothetical protein
LRYFGASNEPVEKPGLKQRALLREHAREFSVSSFTHHYVTKNIFEQYL